MMGIYARFNHPAPPFTLVAQLDRAWSFYLQCWEFKSLRGCQVVDKSLLFAYNYDMALSEIQRYLYAYTTPKDSIEIWKNGRVGVGLIKIGQTNNPDVEQRIRGQLGAGCSNRNYTLLYKKYIGKLTDKTIHRVLKNSGVDFIEHSEWAECSLEELEHAVEVALNGGTAIPQKDMMVYKAQNISRLQDFGSNIMTLTRIAGDLSTRFKKYGLDVPSPDLMDMSKAVEQHLRQYYKEQEAECRQYWRNYYKNLYKERIEQGLEDINTKAAELDNIKETVAASYCGPSFYEDSKNFLNKIKKGMQKRDINVIIEGAFICNTLEPVFKELYKELRRDLMNYFSTIHEYDTGRVKMRVDKKSKTTSPIYRFSLSDAPFRADTYSLVIDFKKQNKWLFDTFE